MPGDWIHLISMVINMEPICQLIKYNLSSTTGTGARFLVNCSSVEKNLNVVVPSKAWLVETLNDSTFSYFSNIYPTTSSLHTSTSSVRIIDMQQGSKVDNQDKWLAMTFISLLTSLRLLVHQLFSVFLVAKHWGSCVFYLWVTTCKLLFAFIRNG